MLISIIVPIYNVQDYLDECIYSLINQTYKNIEIILVDDGSIDKCPQMCDDWANKDTRIRVIHKLNGGLSDARNMGLNFVKGDFLSFVDSDDFVESTYIEKMYSAIAQNPDCSISSCSCRQYINGSIKPIFQDSWNFDRVRFIEPEDYAEKMLLMKSQHTAWGKLYKSSLFNDIRFRKGYTNEDILFALDFYPYIEKYKIRTIEIPDHLYFYRVRKNSICKSGNKFVLDSFCNKETVFKRVKDIKPKIYKYYYRLYLKDLCSFMMLKLNKIQTIPYSYMYLCRKAWMYSDKYAKSNLSKSEYKTFIHGKYFGLLTLFKYRLKAIFKI